MFLLLKYSPHFLSNSISLLKLNQRNRSFKYLIKSTVINFSFTFVHKNLHSNLYRQQLNNLTDDQSFHQSLLLRVLSSCAKLDK